MPPKRWGALPPPRMTRADAVASLTRYVCDAIADSNSLGLPSDEVAGMATVLVESKTRAEVLEWCRTLLLDEAVAAELIKRRVDYGLPFTGEATSSSLTPLREGTAATAATTTTAATTPVATAATTTAPPSTSRHMAVKTSGSRNNNNNSGSKKSNNNNNKKATTALRRGGGDTTTAAALKPGRCECGCFATRHKLRTNCLNCGRIICEQEDDVTCYFCGLPPSRCVAYEIAVQEGRISAAAAARDTAQYNAAIEQRDKLLGYARQRAKRTTVIDDQAASLFDPQNAWLSPEERERAHKTAAAEARQRRLAAMHAHSGAYEVQLQLMGQTVPLSVSKGQPVQIDLVVGRDGAAAAAAAAADDDDEDYGDDDDDKVEDEDATGVEGRALGMTTDELQTIWHEATTMAAATTTTRTAVGSSNTRAVTTTPPMTTLAPPPVQRYDEQSRRVQQDYFADDVRLYRRTEAIARDGGVNDDDDDARGAAAATTTAAAATGAFAGDGDEAAALPELVFDPQRLTDASSSSTSLSAQQQQQTAAAAAATDKDGADGPQQVSTLLPLRFAPTPTMRLRDEGVCLSMHQPWASLLVAGIKRHEGRVWPTDYRGRLWIHAAAAEPRAVAATQEHYAPFVPPGTSFPTHYPTRVLLGYVYLTACLDREAYEAAFAPDERQETSPYSFICASPRALPFPLPMCGAHKLFSLDRKVHTAARKQLHEEAL